MSKFKKELNDLVVECLDPYKKINKKEFDKHMAEKYSTDEIPCQIQAFSIGESDELFKKGDTIFRYILAPTTFEKYYTIDIAERKDAYFIVMYFMENENPVRFHLSINPNEMNGFTVFGAVYFLLEYPEMINMADDSFSINAHVDNISKTINFGSFNISFGNQKTKLPSYHLIKEKIIISVCGHELTKVFLSHGMWPALLVMLIMFEMTKIGILTIPLWSLIAIGIVVTIVFDAITYLVFKMKYQEITKLLTNQTMKEENS